MTCYATPEKISGLNVILWGFAQLFSITMVYLLQNVISNETYFTFSKIGINSSADYIYISVKSVQQNVPDGLKMNVVSKSVALHSHALSYIGLN